VYKFVQIFLDTKLFTTANQGYDPVGLIPFDTSVWKMPLLVQIPTVGPMLVGACWVGIRSLKRWRSLPDIPITVIPVIAGIGLMFGYTSNAGAGSPHLKYGYVRDFLSMSVCFFIAVGPWVFSREAWRRAMACLLLSAAFFFGLPYLGLRLPAFEGFHIREIEAVGTCRRGSCTFAFELLSKDGVTLSLPFEKTIVLQTCDDGKKELVATSDTLDMYFRELDCGRKRSRIAFFPVITGLGASPEGIRVSFGRTPGDRKGKARHGYREKRQRFHIAF
jgi:hypothetical protein